MVRLPAEEARHARSALRLSEGAAVEVCDGCGGVATAEVASLDRNGVSVRVVGTPVVAPPGEWEWTVAVAAGSLKGGRADWLVEKCAELGAAALQPLLTARSPVLGGGGAGAASGSAGKRRGKAPAEDGGEEGATGREARWGRVATAAMKQCLRPRSLSIHAPCALDEAFCARCSEADVALFGMEGAPPVGAVTAELAARLASPRPRESGEPLRGVLIIGPEGDFTAEEVRSLAAAGARGVGLGALRLRSETAAVALLSFASLALAGRPREGMR